MSPLSLGSFSESKEKRLRLDDVESRAFIMTLDIWCGRADGQEMELHEVQQLKPAAEEKTAPTREAKAAHRHGAAAR
jgi:hypothetical protein